jgi:hypothetical protein
VDASGSHLRCLISFYEQLAYTLRVLTHLQHLLTRVAASMNQGQVLENIKMAYWWAGYYSGMYDAKQAGTQPSEK